MMLGSFEKYRERYEVEPQSVVGGRRGGWLWLVVVVLLCLLSSRADAGGTWSTDCVSGGSYTSLFEALNSCIQVIQASSPALVAYATTFAEQTPDVAYSASVWASGGFVGTAHFNCVGDCGSGSGSGTAIPPLSMDDAATWGFAFGGLMLTAWAFKMLVRALGADDMSGGRGPSFREDE